MEPVLDYQQQQQEVQHQYAGFWIRFGALLIDIIILSIVQFLIRLAFTGSSGFEEESDTGNDLLLSLINFIIAIAYFAGFESSSKQATLGKQAVGIQVIDGDGDRMSFINAVGRYLGKIISGLILFIGYIMVAWDDKKQGLHDKMANTYVVYKRPEAIY